MLWAVILLPANSFLEISYMAFSHVPSGIAYTNNIPLMARSQLKVGCMDEEKISGYRVVWLLKCMPRLHVAGDRVTAWAWKSLYIP